MAERTVDQPTGPVAFSFTTSGGVCATAEADFEPDEAPEPGSPLRTRRVTVRSYDNRLVLQQDRIIVQKWVPRHIGAGDHRAYDLLDDEVRIGLRLVRRFGEQSYPGEFARLIGYDADADEPFLLLEMCRGEPVATVAGKLSLDQQRAFRISMFRGVRLLEKAGVVHRNITSHTVYWDGAGAQIADFGQATFLGEPRRRAGSLPWASPEQRRGTGMTDTRDDVWSAGWLVYYVETGLLTGGAGGQPDMSSRGAALQSALQGVFATALAHRPDAGDILRRLHAQDPWSAVPVAVDQRFEEGKARFYESLRQKWPHSDSGLEQDPDSEWVGDPAPIPVASDAEADQDSLRDTRDSARDRSAEPPRVAPPGG